MPKNLGLVSLFGALLFGACTLDFSDFNPHEARSNEVMGPLDGDEAACGNGMLESGEFCEPELGEGCPTACTPKDACDRPELVGEAADCSARCEPAAITERVPDDGCCPDGANHRDDKDCACNAGECAAPPPPPPDTAVEAVCGNGILDGEETCDPPGSCPVEAQCVSTNACIVASWRGSAESCDAVCAQSAVLACTSGDGCCPAGCARSTDDDCPEAELCGNGVIDEGETCDDACPGECSVSSVCMMVRIVGSASDCTSACVTDPVLACQADDGCCPEGCNTNTDSDCPSACGNGALEGAELCEVGVGDGCQESCAPDGDPCTDDVLVGEPASCDVHCEYPAITAAVAGDQCCPAGENATTDADCGPVCGNGILEPGETCEPSADVPCPECDPGDADICVRRELQGSAETCDAVCVEQPICMFPRFFN